MGFAEGRAWGAVVGTYLDPEGILDALSQTCHQQGQEAGEKES